LGSHKVEEWVVNSFGSKTIFYQFVEANLSQFYVASENRVACCHPEVPLNTRRHNSYLPGHCGDWDYVHTGAKVDHYGCIIAPCTVAMDICNGIGDSAAFQLMEASAKEMYERKRQHQLALAKAGKHPFQQKEHKEVTKKRQLSLLAAGNHNFQQEANGERAKQRQLALSAAGQHNMQLQSAAGQQKWQQDEHKEANKKRQLALSAAGNHPMHRPEVVAKNKASRLAGAAKKQNKKKCSHPGCDNQAKTDGVCYTHGANRKKCSFPDCNNQAVNNGVCIRHGAIAPQKKKCKHEGCTNQAKKGGVCNRHGAKDL